MQAFANPKDLALARTLYANKTIPIDDICRQFSVSRPTLYRYVRLETASQSPATGRVGRKGTPTGHLAHLEAKAEGDRSMSGKRWLSGGVQDKVPRGPCDMAKAELLEV